MGGRHLASRFTGFLRTFVLLYALGTKNLGDATVANSVPNAVYNLAVGGILTAVVVPLLVHGRSATTTGVRPMTSGCLPWVCSRSASSPR